MRFGLLVLMLLAAAVAGMACNGGSSSGPAVLGGRVLSAEDGSGVAGATVEILGAHVFTSDQSGRFGPTALASGGYGFVAAKEGFHTLQSNVMVEGGENHLHIELIACRQPFDSAPGCVPTGTNTPAPATTPNVFLLFDGENLPNDNNVPPWTGNARLNPGTERIIGDGGAGFQEAISECWVTPDYFNLIAGDNANRTISGDPMGAVDSCTIRWYGEDEAVVNPGVYRDAMVEVRVVRNGAGFRWADNTRFDAKDPDVTIAYYEGTISNPNVDLTFTPGPGLTFVATTGSILLLDNGYFIGQAVVTSAAAFVIPNLP